MAQINFPVRLDPDIYEAIIKRKDTLNGAPKAGKKISMNDLINKACRYYFIDLVKNIKKEQK